MLIIDRTQRIWATLSAVVCLVAGMVYFWYASTAPDGPSGGSVPGLIFGLIAAAMMVFAGLLAARRRFPAARIGSAQFWMKGHLWIGTLTVPFALFHAGFGWGGAVEVLLWVLFFAVILSGFWGLFLQQLLPRMMLENLPRETFIEQIPYLCQRFTAESDNLLAEVCGPLEVTVTAVELKQFEPHLRPYFEEHRKKNRNDYPKTASEAAQFQKFLTRIYASVPAPALTATSPSAPPAVANKIEAPTPAATATPALKSVAQIKSPLLPELADVPVAPTAAAAVAETPAAKPKPNPQALLAAARAKAAAATPPAGPLEADTAGTAAAPPPKPDPRAMLAAAKAKKALEHGSAEDAGAATGTPPVPITDPALKPLPAKPDPKAILAAARAKKAAETAAATPEPQSESSTAELSPAVIVNTPVAPAKPDPKAMLAAAKARREAAAGVAATPVLHAPEVPAASEGPVATEIAPPAPAHAAPSGKPDPKAMMAAMKAKREAAAQATGVPAAEAVPAAKPNPLAQLKDVAQLKAVKDLPARAEPALVAAARVAPPTPKQTAELKLFYLELIRPQLPMQRATRSWNEAIRRSVMACNIRSDNQHPEFIRVFEQLLDLCEQRRQFALTQRYHAWLHGWLLAHIPCTVALYLILAAHAVFALRVIPFGN